jgi:multiple sugar transport system substrate-binding protein
MSVTLKGMTWNHPRGYDPLVACAHIWREKTGIDVIWEKRSLQDFETYPVDELARAFDLIVIDHPHIGQIAGEGCLASLDVAGREAERLTLHAASVGGSYKSYEWEGHQWAFPIDAASQVQAVRPDLVAQPPLRWSDVLDLAAKGLVLLPLRPPHSLMTFYTLAANLGTPCRSNGKGLLIDAAAGARVVSLMRDLVVHLDPVCFDLDPIAVLERMSAEGSTVACSPLIYGYVSYSMAGFRPHPLRFGNIPAAGNFGPAGSALGGTGIAVSAFSAASEQAIDFAYWVASGDVQSGPYAAAGGQPGNAQAWEDDTVNASTENFYRGSRDTLESSWIRPRYDGYMAFQQQGSDCINSGLLRGKPPEQIVEMLNRLFSASFAGE